MGRTALQQINDLRDSLVEKMDIAEWVEDTWSEVAEGERFAHLLMGELESLLDPARGRNETPAGFLLMFRHETVDRTNWLAGRVWSQFNYLDKRISSRLNAITAAEHDAPKPDAAEPPEPSLLARSQVTDLIDDLGNAIDRIEGLFALVRDLPKDAGGAAIERLLGDVHVIVCKTHAKVDAAHNGGAA